MIIELLIIMSLNLQSREDLQLDNSVPDAPIFGPSRLHGHVINENELGIIGVSIGILGESTIHKVYDNGPAKSGGLLPGDKIILVDGIKGSRGIAQIDGEPGSLVILGIKRGDKFFTAHLIRMAVREVGSKELNQYFGINSN